MMSQNGTLQNAQTSNRRFYDSFWRARRGQVPALMVSHRLKIREFGRLIRAYAKSGSEVLDVGCGDGRLAALLARTCRVSAFDYSSKAVEDNSRLHPTVRFFCADALCSPPVEEVARYDLVTCMDVIEHVPFEKQKSLVQHLAIFLKARGILVISTPDREQSLRYKTDPDEPDCEFLRRFEGQPCADCLTAPELDGLLSEHFEVLVRTSVVPAIRSRAVDLAWKITMFGFGFRGVNWITNVVEAPGKYLVRLGQKKCVCLTAR